MRTLLLGASLLLALVASSAPLEAQIRLTISGLPLAKTSTPPSDFDSPDGAVIGSMAYVIEAMSNGGRRQATLEVRCATPCPASGSADASRVEWRLADQAGWTPLTTSYVVIDSKPIRRNDGENNPFGNTIVWRYRLDWEQTPPSTLTRYDLQFRLTVTNP